MTFVKFCGITRDSDAAFAVELGVQAIGFVQAESSPRFLPPVRAAAIRRRLPAGVRAVALFRNPSAEQVHAAIAEIRPDVLQFHGEEDPAFCEGFGLPYWKAVPMGQDQALPGWAGRFPGAEALLLDAHVEGGAGGTGRSFDWSRAGSAGKPVVLAGGLRPDNVAEAVRIARPWAVDVSSGIESRPGIKDTQRMRDFMAAVEEADRGQV